MADAGIVRSRAKIQAAIQNAKVFLAIQKEFGSFDCYLWGFSDGQPIVNRDDVFHTTTDLSDRISRDLKRPGDEVCRLHDHLFLSAGNGHCERSRAGLFFATLIIWIAEGLPRSTLIINSTRGMATELPKAL